MTVQIKPSKPKDQFNGLSAIEAQLLAHPDQEIHAVVTFTVDKRVEDLSKSPIENYPVLGMKHIEPILGEAEERAVELQLLAYQSRTGENELDFSFTDEPADEEADQ